MEYIGEGGEFFRKVIAIKAREFMKRINLVKEREGQKTHRVERLFFLTRRN